MNTAQIKHMHILLFCLFFSFSATAIEYERDFENYAYDSIIAGTEEGKIAKVEYSFDKYANIYTRTIYENRSDDLQTELWQTVSLDSIIIDNINNTIDSLTYTVKPTGEYILTAKSNTKFVEYTSMTTETYTLYSLNNGVPTPEWRTISDQNRYNEVGSIEKQMWNEETEVFIPVLKIDHAESAYSGITDTYKTYTETGEWETSYITTERQSFDENENIISSHITVTIYKDGGPYTERYTSYEYDENGQLSLYTDSVSVRQNNTTLPLPTIKTVREYVDEKLMTETVYAYNDNNSKWYTDAIKKYTYEDNTIKKISSQYYSTNEIIGSIDEVLSIHNRNNTLIRTEQKKYHFVDGEKVLSSEYWVNYYTPFSVLSSDLDGKTLTVACDDLLDLENNSADDIKVEVLTGNKELNITGVSFSDNQQEMLVSFDRSPSAGESYIINFNNGITAYDGRNISFSKVIGDAASVLVTPDDMAIYEEKDIIVDMDLGEDNFTYTYLSSASHGLDSVLFYTPVNKDTSRILYAQNDAGIYSSSVYIGSYEDAVNRERYERSIDSTKREITDEYFFLQTGMDTPLNKTVTTYNESWQPLTKTTYYRTNSQLGLSNDFKKQTYTENNYNSDGQITARFNYQIKSNTGEMELSTQEKWEYDAFGMLISHSVQNAVKERFDRSYEIKDGKAYLTHISTYRKNNNDKLEKTASATYTYNSEDQVETWTDSSFNTSFNYLSGVYTFHYDDQGRPIKRVKPGNSYTITYNGDFLSKKEELSIKDSGDTTAWTIKHYNSLGKVMHEDIYGFNKNVFLLTQQKCYYYPLYVKGIVLNEDAQLTIQFNDSLLTDTDIIDKLALSTGETSDIVQDAYIDEENRCCIIVKLYDQPENGESFTLQLNDGVFADDGRKAQFEFEVGNQTTDLESNGQEFVLVSPTLAQSEINIAASSAIKNIALCNIDGVQSAQFSNGQANCTIATETFAAGTYILSIQLETGSIYSKKVMIRK